LYGRLPGFRVQLLADSSWLQARDNFYLAQQQLPLSLHLEYDSPWWKLLAGDFSTREDAARARHQLTTQGWPDAWIVNCRVIIAGPLAAASEPEPLIPVYSFFTIQVAALRDTSNLVEFRSRLGELVILSELDSFQICVGRFEQRNGAQAVLSGIRQQYPAAFIRKTGGK
ncbi:MAG: SPOR domain-containing protein, partial [Candidatus Delongbacteria bacterium]|nr:SPOR domain-containing protein [Candidatus Delongbacteria bacterium]